MSTPDNPELDDVAKLIPLTENACVELIQKRYQSAPTGKQYDKIHTRAGSVVVAINPLTYDVKDVIYTSASRQKYHAAASRDPADEDPHYVRPPPHIYEVVAKAFVGISRYNECQALVINGESGSGKTETTKLLLEYLSEMSSGSAKSSGGPSLTEKLMASSPVLEACGNAKTLRNDNSSRFGKLIKLNFNKDAQLLYCSMEHYLLEVSRVTSQHTGEQGYHIFYYLTMCVPDALRTKLGLQQDGYRYLIKPDDTLKAKFPKEWKECQTSLATMLGCAPESDDVVAVWKVVAAVLHLGQIEFDEKPGEKGDPESNISEASIKTATVVAEMLGIDLETLRTALITRLIMKQQPPRTKNEAGQARDALARTLYKYLFNVIVDIVNKALTGSSADSSELFIGMLDIFGSEVLSVNSFEQLLINYANDKLQLFFTDVTFMNIKKEYEAEGVDQHMKEIKDISPTLETIEGVPIEVRGRWERTECMLSIFDADTLASDKANQRGGAESRDSKLLKTLVERIGKKDGFIPYAGIINSRSREMRDNHPKIVENNGHKYETSFIVVHFGNEVPYCVEGFCERNADQLDTHLKKLLKTCADKNKGNAFMHAIFDQDAAKERSIAFKFREEMTKLVDNQLRKCNGHFIRCIKPNNERKPFLLDPATCTPQLQSCGVKEAAVVAQAGFDKSYKPQDFVNILVDHAIQNATWERLSDDKKGKLALHYLRKVFKLKPDSFAVGRTKIFFRPGVWEQIMAREAECDTIANEVRKVRKRREMKAKMQKLKDDIKNAGAKARIRRISVIDDDAQRQQEEKKEEENQRKLTAAVGKAIAETDMAHQEELEKERLKAKDKMEAELERLRQQKELEIQEAIEAVQAPVKARMVKMELDFQEAQRQNEELSEFRNEADYLREELRKYKTEVAVLRGILKEVKEKTSAYISAAMTDKGRAKPQVQVEAEADPREEPEEDPREEPEADPREAAMAEDPRQAA